MPSRLRELATVGAALQLVSFVWFVVLVIVTLVLLNGATRIWQLDVLVAWLAFSFPPLIMHITYCEVAAGCDTAPSAPWRVLIWLMYIAMHGTMVWSFLVFADVIHVSHQLASRTLGLGIGLGFILAAVYAIALVGTWTAEEGNRPRTAIAALAPRPLRAGRRALRLPGGTRRP